MLATRRSFIRALRLTGVGAAALTPRDIFDDVLRAGTGH
jgi:hypothetical protein